MSSDEELIGATVVDDLMIEYGFSDAAKLKGTGPPCIFRASGAPASDSEEQDDSPLVSTEPLKTFTRITGLEFQSRVVQATDVTIVLITATPCHESDVLRECVAQVALRFRRVQFHELVSSPEIEVPPEDLPVLMAYRDGRVAAQFSRLASIAGPRTTPDSVEWCLAKCGVLLSDMEEDPNESFKMTRVDKTNREDDDDDSDW